MSNKIRLRQLETSIGSFYLFNSYNSYLVQAKLQRKQAARNQLAIYPFHLSSNNAVVATWNSQTQVLKCQVILGSTHVSQLYIGTKDIGCLTAVLVRCPFRELLGLRPKPDTEQQNHQTVLHQVLSFFCAIQGAIFTKIKQINAALGGRFSSFSALGLSTVSVLVSETTGVSSFCEAIGPQSWDSYTNGLRLAKVPKTCSLSQNSLSESRWISDEFSLIISQPWVEWADLRYLSG